MVSEDQTKALWRVLPHQTTAADHYVLVNLVGFSSTIHTLVSGISGHGEHPTRSTPQKTKPNLRLIWFVYDGSTFGNFIMRMPKICEKVRKTQQKEFTGYY